MNILRSTRELRDAQYWELARLVRAIRKAVEFRNPIAVNMYTGYIESAALALDEISGGEIGNFTSEHGPRERRPPRTKKEEPFKSKHSDCEYEGQLN